MAERSKKKCFVRDDEISTLFQRYSPTTVLALLQEVAQQVREVSIDWNSLVKKTKTGITNAREYQQLWRHLAYRHALPDVIDEAQPLDYDSDLEYELEAYPAVSSEASVEARACVKVLIASGTQNDSQMSNGSTVEVPLTISIPNGQRSRSSSETSHETIPMQGSNIIVPVSVPKNPLPNVISTKGSDADGPSGANFPPQRKRKLWSQTEDMELIAAVKKHGEGNWANISRGDFKGARTVSQLKKRWGVITKQQGVLVRNNPELSEIHLTHRAVSLALDAPMRDTSEAACSIRSEGTNRNAASRKPANPLAYDTSSVDTKSQHQGRQDFASKLGMPGPSRSLVSEKPSAKPTMNTNSMVKAAAVAAGARIASPSDVASLLKAAQSKNAVHIIPGGGPSIKSSLSGNTSALPSNVQRQNGNPTSSAVQSNLVGMASGLKASTKVVLNGTDSNPAADCGIKPVEDTVLSGLEIVSEKVALENQATYPHIALEGDHIASTRNEVRGDQIGIPENLAREKNGTTCFPDDPLLTDKGIIKLQLS